MGLCMLSPQKKGKNKWVKNFNVHCSVNYHIYVLTRCAYKETIRMLCVRFIDQLMMLLRYIIYLECDVCMLLQGD